MPPKIFASLHEFVEDGPVYGRLVANAGYMQALLTCDPFDQYHFFVHEPARMQAWLGKNGHIPAVGRGAVRIFGRTQLPQAVGTTPFHCFHLSDPFSTGFAQIMALRNRLAPGIFPVTSLTHSLSYMGYGLGFVQHVWPGVTRRDAIVASSRAAASVVRGYLDHVRAAYALPESWQAPQVPVIPLGIDVQRFHVADTPTRTAARSKLDLPQDAIICLAHGRVSIDDKMDLMPLLYALARTLPQGACPHLLVSGRVRQGDSYVQTLEMAAKALKIPFTLMADPTDGQLPQLFAAADMFCSPSDNIQESFGITPLEAAACGLPAIVADWDGYRDLVEDGVTGYAVPTLTTADTPWLDGIAPCLPDNVHQLFRAQQCVVDVPALARAIAALTTDAGLRQRMGRAARKRMEQKFAWDVVIGRWLEFWEKLANTPLTEDEEKRARAAINPTFPPFGQVFANHATLLLPEGDAADGMRVRLTERGERVRKGVEFNVTWPTLELCMQGIDSRQLLVAARKPIGCGQLVQRLRSAGATPEAAQFALLWALKNDLLELVQV